MIELKSLVCVAQARVLEGRKKPLHVCTIAYNQSNDCFIRLCLPWQQDTGIRRWTEFDVAVERGDDTRKESYDFGQLLRKGSTQLSNLDRIKLHKKILQKYKTESELNSARESIGIIIPDRQSLRFVFKDHDEKDKRFSDRMACHGVYYPEKSIFVVGKSKQFATGRFRKRLLQWDVAEAMRKGLSDPVAALRQFKEPYIIIGNTPLQRNSFVAVAVMSAPQGMTQQAFNQQLSLIA